MVININMLFRPRIFKKLYTMKTLYTQAVIFFQSHPRRTHFNKRDEYRFIVNDYISAVHNKVLSLRYDYNHADGFIQLARSYTNVGDISNAKMVLNILEGMPNQLSIFSENFKDKVEIEKNLAYLQELQRRIELARRFNETMDALTCLSLIEKFKRIAPNCLSYEGLKEQCLGYLDRFTESNHHYKTGLSLYGTGNLEESIRHFNSCLDLNPDHERARIILQKAESLKSKKVQGNNYYQLRKYQEALTCYNDALIIDPSNTGICSILYFNRGQTYAKLGNLIKAIRDYSLAISHNNKYFNAIFFRAKAYFEVQKYEKCRSDCEKLEGICRYTFESQRLKATCERKINECYIKAKNLYYTGDLDAGIESFEQVLKYSPSHANAKEILEKAKMLKTKKDLGNRYFNSSDYRKALFTYTEALAIDQSNKYINSILYYNCALSQAQLGYIHTALTNYSEALKLNSKNVKAVMKRALLFFELKKYPDCLQDCENAIALNPSLSEAISLKEKCSKIVEIETKTEDLFRLGMTFYNDGNLDESTKNFIFCLEYKPTHEKARYYLEKSKLFRKKIKSSNELFSAGRYQEALRVLNETLDIDPQNKAMNNEILYSRALVYKGLRRFNDAVDDCSKVLRVNAKHSEAITARAELYFELEEYEKCICDCENVLKLKYVQEIEQLLRIARVKLQEEEDLASDGTDPFLILGIVVNASIDVVKKAYRTLALKYHPDKHPNVSAKRKKLIENKMKKINEAYAKLQN